MFLLQINFFFNFVKESINKCFLITLLNRHDESKS